MHHIQVGFNSGMQDECIGYLCCIKNKTPKPKWQHSETVACKVYFFSQCHGLAGLVLPWLLSWLQSAGSSAGGWKAQDDLTHVSGTSFAMSGMAGILGLSLHKGNPGLFHVGRSVLRGREQRNKTLEARDQKSLCFLCHILIKQNTGQSRFKGKGTPPFEEINGKVIRQRNTKDGRNVLAIFANNLNIGLIVENQL